MSDDDPGSILASAFLRERIEAHLQQFTRAERLVAEHFLKVPPADLAFLSAEDLAQATGTSDATVIRTARRLGFSGLPELKRQVTRSIAINTPVEKRLERKFTALPAEARIAGEAIFAAAREIVDSTEETTDYAAIDSAAGLLREARDIWCLGMGMSEPPARHLCTALLRTGLRTRISTASGFTLANDMVGLGPNDCVVIFQAAQRRKDIEALVEHANAVGAGTILISGAQLNTFFTGKVSVALRAMGVASRLASWSIGAMIVADLLTHSVAAGALQKAIDTHARLRQLRQSFE